MTQAMPMSLQPFVDSTPLIADPDALRARMAADGYLFLRAVAPTPTLRALRREIVEICQRQGWLKPGSEPMEAVSWTAPKVEGEEDYFAVYDEVQRLESFYALAHHAPVIGLMRAVLGPSAFPHPLSICRLVFPQAEEWSTPPHQDYPNNQGTPDLYACWIPLGDCPRALGSLSVLEGSHRMGVLPLTFSLGAGGRTVVLDDRFDRLTWRGGDFAAGDVIVFHSHTVHQAEPNRLDRMRISVDYRYQRESEPITQECLEPHFRREDWNAIYAGWQRTDLQYYWRGKDLPLAAWDDSYHVVLKDEAFMPAVGRRLVFDEKRRLLGERFKAGAD